MANYHKAGPDDLKEAARLAKKGESLRAKREESWTPVYKDLRDYFAPYDGQFEGDLRNDGKRRDQKINNPRPLKSVNVLRAGMTSGMTSKSRPWFALGLPDGTPLGMEAKRWLYAVQEAIRRVLAKSNVYTALPMIYGSQGVYGTGVMGFQPDEQNVVRFRHYPTGTYALDVDAEGRVDTFYREFFMTPRQLAQRFGVENLCPSTKAAAERGDLSDIAVCHLIEPNSDADARKLDNKSMGWKSSYWEKGQSKLLRQSGFRYFPILAPRWDVNGNNVYGTGPGHIVLGKSKELQLLERDKMKLVGHLTNPNRTAPVSLQAAGGANLVPGGVTFLPDNLVGAALLPTYVPDPAAIPNVRAEILLGEQDIAEAFFEDLFLMITQSDGTMTAYEVAKREEEKMLMLGPVVERNSDELLDPLIEGVYAIMLEQSLPRWMGILPGAPLIPPPPEELQNVALEIEYVSILAQAQKLVSVSSIERAVAFTGGLVQAGFQDALDKFNADVAQDEYYDAIGAPPTMLRSDDEVAAIRDARAQAQAQQAQLEQGQALVDAAQTLSQTPTGGDTALAALAEA